MTATCQAYNPQLCSIKVKVDINVYVHQQGGGAVPWLLLVLLALVVASLVVAEVAMQRRLYRERRLPR